MKNSAICYAILIITAGLFIGFSCTPGQNHENSSKSVHQVLDSEEIPLIYHMSFMSRYTKKLYFSGKAENWELADIYSHEIEEIAELIADRNYEDEEFNISELMEAMLLPQIEQVEEAIDHQDPELFEQRYQALIQTCNQCHAATNYGAVRVTTPVNNPFNQDFSISE